jgi:AraC-like DNA-binding protein
MVRAATRDRQVFHRHDDVRVVLYVGGAMSEETFGGAGRYRSGDFVFRPLYFSHANIAGEDGATYLQLKVSGGAARQWASQRGWKAGRGHVDLAHLDLAAMLLAPNGGDQLLDLATFEAHPEAISAPMNDLALQLTLGVAQLADAAHARALRPYELTRRFQAVFGLAPRAYGAQARLQRAMRMLAEGAHSLAAIAADTGFHDQSHLTRALKRETNMTPRVFRAAACFA